MADKEILIVASKLKKAVKALDLNCAGDVIEALSNQLYEVIAGAAENAKADKRKTLMVKDL